MCKLEDSTGQHSFTITAGQMAEENPLVAESVHIRPLTDSDSLVDLTDLLHRAYKRLLDMGLRYVATSQDAEQTKSRIAGGSCLVAISGEQVVGTVCYHRSAPWPGVNWFDLAYVAEVSQFAVEPALQRNGIGSALMERVEAMARADGATELALSTAEPATHLIAYYEKRGYRIVEHTDATQPNYRSVIMSKPLDRRFPKP
jgi:GNAT superfamily N-acetyltransferase